MLTRIKTTFCVALSTLMWVSLSALPMIYTGTIQFPSNVAKIPGVRIYFQGTKVKYEVIGKSGCFSIPADRNRLQFWILISEHLHFNAEENTIKHWRIDADKPYKLYHIRLYKKEAKPESSTKQNEYVWKIEELFLEKNTPQIPDDAIIIYYNADFVQKLEGGNAIELPKIIIRSDILTLVGSEEQLHDTSVALLMSSLDYDTVHANPQLAISPQQDGAHLVMLTT